MEDNCNDLFTDFFHKDDFNYIYKYLCKIVHPSSLKELLAYLSNTIKYKSNLLINLKYSMVLIKYMYLNYLRKKIKMPESQFDLNFIDYCTNNKYIENNKKICNELALLFKEHDKEIVKNVTELI